MRAKAAQSQQTGAESKSNQVSSLHLRFESNHLPLFVLLRRIRRLRSDARQEVASSPKRQSTISEAPEMDAIFKDHLKKRRRKAAKPDAAPRNASPAFLFLAFIMSITITSNLKQSVANAQDLSSSSSSFFDEPQPFVYMALNFESGSGDGGYPARARAQTNSDLSQLNLADQSSSVSPSLIAAKCWNNNQIDSSQCRQFNVISSANAPQANRPEDDDSLITPVLLFESSSSLDAPPPSAADKHLSPPYLSSTWSPDSNHVHRVIPDSSNVLAPPHGDATQPIPVQSVTMRPTSRIHVATPRPMTGGSTSTSKTSTTQGRKCRDDNDEDCDEPDEPKAAPADGKSEPDSEDDSDSDEDGEDDTSDVSLSTPAHNQEHSKASELGSGAGPADDNDGGDDSDDNAEGASSVSEEQNELTTRHAEMSSEFYPSLPSSVYRPTPFVSSVWTSGVSTSTPSPSTSSQQSTTARIDVVVHSTLPPLFPTKVSTGQTSRNDGDSLPRPGDLLDSSDTFTSLPVFPPPSVSANSTSQDSDAGANSVDADQRIYPGELDLATFKPIPFSLADSQKRPTTVISPLNESDNRVVQASEPPETFKFNQVTSRFENPWQHSSSTRAPIMRAPAPSELPMRAPPGQDLPMTTTRVSTEMLPQMILYSSIVILIVTAIIFVLMALTLWRRNNGRQQALLQKSQLLNGRTNQMVASLSHASQLMHPPPGRQPLVPNQVARQPGLLSTYAPGKGLSMSKVTTSLVKNSDDNPLVNDEVDVEEDDQLLCASTTSDARVKSQLGERQQQHQLSNRLQNSWSNSATTTTSNSHSSSQRTDASHHDNPNGEQNADGQRTYHHSNSLSDGRQNSSSISDSQELPHDSGMAPAQAQPFLTQPRDQPGPPLSAQMSPYTQGQPQSPYRPQPIQHGYYNDRPFPNNYRPPAFVPAPAHFYPRTPGPMVPSRSFEDLQRRADLELATDRQVPKGLPHLPALKPPHLGRLTPAYQQQVVYPYHDPNLYPYGPPPHANMVASNPLATMARGGYSGHYMSQQQPNGPQAMNYNGVPPPVVGRKDRSEAWYV